MTKQEIREYIKIKKLSLTAEQIKHDSDLLTQKFISQDFFLNCSVLYAYMTYNQEIITHDIIKHAWKLGKKVAIPKTYNKSYMEFCYIESFDEVTRGYCNIPEPTTDNIAQDNEALILMPGLAFDNNLNRIGYGGGFYDKYLSQHNTAHYLKVALGFDFQLLDSIETNDYDIKMDIIITPSNKIQ